MKQVVGKPLMIDTETRILFFEAQGNEAITFCDDNVNQCVEEMQIMDMDTARKPSKDIF
jgi:hypothetical protein